MAETKVANRESLKYHHRMSEIIDRTLRPGSGFAAPGFIPDEEYPAYLKKQSYDDLVSISCSIDQETQARRYEMVLAEMAERDKRGEKPETNWHGNATLLLGIIFILNFIRDLIMSRTGWNPVNHLAVGIVCLITGWVSRKKRDR